MDFQNFIYFFDFSRLGFCGESYPRFILPTEIDETLEGKQESSLYDQTVAFFTKIFFK